MTLEEMKHHRVHYSYFGSLPIEVIDEIFEMAESTLTASSAEATKPKKVAKPDTLETSA